jgi:hypothetical protein
MDYRIKIEKELTQKELNWYNRRIEDKSRIINLNGQWMRL